jgi:hypothetical protein
MSDGIFLLRGDELVEMRQQPYDSEAVLQTLLEKYPNLLAGEQIGDTRLRWLLVKREAGVPAQEGGGARWSLDHLFVDQEAVPTLVEVKRSDDTRIRREVVGQMLDYAANGVVYWPAERLRSDFSSRCVREHREPDEVFRESLGEDVDPEGFWDAVEQNLRSGRVRLVFVADEIPPELRRVIEFLNERMSPTEVIGIEVRQYVGEGELKTLVPRVMGQTEEARIQKVRTSSPAVDADWEYYEKALSPDRYAIARDCSIELSAPSLSAVYRGLRFCVGRTSGFSARRATARSDLTSIGRSRSSSGSSFRFRLTSFEHSGIASTIRIPISPRTGIAATSNGSGRFRPAARCRTLALP